jgi:hypothetical protein
VTQPLGWVNPRVGFDNYTFSPGVKASTIWVVLPLAIFNNWPLCQLDVKNVFLRGFLREKVYMEQLLVILVPDIPHMCVGYVKNFMGLNKPLELDYIVLALF